MPVIGIWVCSLAVASACMCASAAQMISMLRTCATAGLFKESPMVAYNDLFTAGILSTLYVLYVVRCTLLGGFCTYPLYVSVR
jgi:hypothetical protein